MHRHRLTVIGSTLAAMLLVAISSGSAEAGAAQADAPGPTGAMEPGMAKAFARD